MTPIPRGVYSTRQHEPLPDHGKSYMRCMGGRFCTHAPGTCTASPEYQAMLREKCVDLLPDAPSSQPMLQADVESAIINAGGNPVRAAIAVLSITRIAKALKLMDDVDSGAVELIAYGSKLESSDAR